jgi:hypothetical protein
MVTEMVTNNTEGLPVFFIIGLPRSGTTLLEQMLDGHSRLAVCPEMASGQALWRLNATEEIRDFWKHIMIINSCYNRSSLFQDPINPCLAHLAIRDIKFPVSLTQWFNTLISDYLLERKASLFGEKTPENTFFIPVLSKSFPNSRFIFLWRNPFDIITSLAEAVLNSKDVPLPDKWLFHFASLVKRGMKDMIGHRQLENSRALWITYEDLTRYPDVILKKACDFLEIEYEDGMLAFQGKKKYARNKEVMHRILSRLDEPLTDQRINRSYSILSPMQYAYLHAYWTNELKLLPYEFPPVSEKLSWMFKMRLYMAILAFHCRFYLVMEYVNKLRTQYHYYALRYLNKTYLRARLFKNLIVNEKDWKKIITQDKT